MDHSDSTRGRYYLLKKKTADKIRLAKSIMKECYGIDESNSAPMIADEEDRETVYLNEEEDKERARKWAKTIRTDMTTALEELKGKGRAARQNGLTREERLEFIKVIIVVQYRYSILLKDVL